MDKNKIKNKVIIGGTFDLLHKGHEAFLKEAFRLGQVTLGLTSDKMAEATKKRKVGRFFSRKKELEKFFKEELKEENYKIIKIEDKFGPTLKEDFDYIVVSQETYKKAVLINKKRKEIKRKPIKIIKIKFVLAENGRPISASQIKKRQMDRRGRLLIKK